MKGGAHPSPFAASLRAITDSKYWVMYENVCICILCLKININKKKKKGGAITFYLSNPEFPHLYLTCDIPNSNFLEGVCHL